MGTLQEIIVSLIYGQPIPSLECGLYVHKAAELFWLLPVEPQEPVNGGYRRVFLTPERWTREEGRKPALRYGDKVLFQCGTNWGTVYGWWLANQDGKIIYCRPFRKPIKMKKGWLGKSRVEFEIRLSL